MKIRILIVSLIIVVGGIGFYLICNPKIFKTKQVSENSLQTEKNNSKLTQVEELKENIMLQDQKEESVDEIKNNTEVKEESKQTTNSSKKNSKQNVQKKETNSSASKDTTKAIVPFKEDEEQKKPVSSSDSTKSEPSICSKNDAGWKAFVDKKKKQGTYIFTSEKEAIDYGNFAMEFGYGYWRDTIPQKYKTSNCTQNYWSVELYIPAKVCKKDGEYNSKINITPAIEKSKIIDIIDYLENLGFDCGNKKAIN